MSDALQSRFPDVQEMLPQLRARPGLATRVGLRVLALCAPSSLIGVARFRKPGPLGKFFVGDEEADDKRRSVWDLGLEFCALRSLMLFLRRAVLCVEMPWAILF